MKISPYKVIALTNSATVPVIAHVPHASTFIPQNYRDNILLNDKKLKSELAVVTDWHVDELFDWLLGLGVTIFKSNYSRLVFDPERFRNDLQEPLSRIGRGVVYTQTMENEPLRKNDLVERSEILEKLYDPYHKALTELASTLLQDHGRCLILDCHSFSSDSFPESLDEMLEYPEICIGTDDFHTPQKLTADLTDTLRSEGYRTRRNIPFDGALVPLKFYGCEQRVSSIMIEIRRQLYCDEKTGNKNENFSQTKQHLRLAVTETLTSFLARP